MDDEVTSHSKEIMRFVDTEKILRIYRVFERIIVRILAKSLKEFYLAPNIDKRKICGQCYDVTNGKY